MFLESQIDEIYSTFETASKGLNFTAYKKGTINETKPYWYYQNNPRITPIILVADLGYAFEDFYGPRGKMAYYDRKFNVSRKSLLIVL